MSDWHKQEKGRDTQWLLQMSLLFRTPDTYFTLLLKLTDIPANLQPLFLPLPSHFLTPSHQNGSFSLTVWCWHQHSFISRFRNTIGWTLQEPDQHPPTVKYVWKNSKVRPRQRHRDGSLSNFHLSETLLRANTPLFVMFTDWKSHRWSNGKNKKRAFKKIPNQDLLLVNPIIWTSDWSSEAAGIWDVPFCFYFKGRWPWRRTRQGQRCVHA